MLAHAGKLEEAVSTAGESVTAMWRVRDPLDGPTVELADTLTEVTTTLIKADRWDLAGPLLAELTTLHRLLVLAGSDEHVPFLQATLQIYGAYEQLDPGQRKRYGRKSRCSASGRTGVSARDRAVGWAASAMRGWRATKYRGHHDRPAWLGKVTMMVDNAQGPANVSGALGRPPVDVARSDRPLGREFVLDIQPDWLESGWGGLPQTIARL